MSQAHIIYTNLSETPSLPQAPIYTGELTISVPNNIPATLPPQYWGTEGTILAIAILIRSIALLLHVLKSGPKK
ncbi:hypothetical protein [Microcoleus sp. N3A4]|uniref:hypothetical protein n=1 Tax=Microcoleus sp. N3A4 TaxID=3055379 RepID=UPI002FD0F520